MESFKVDIYADGASLEDVETLKCSGKVKGFTFNPTLFRKLEIRNYLEYCKQLTNASDNLPISLEVIGDTSAEMIRQAMILSKLGSNVFVKVPVTNSMGEDTREVIQTLQNQGVKLNVTAVFTLDQLNGLASILSPKVDSFVSIFAGRIADTGRDPESIVQEGKRIFNNHTNLKIIWASPREVFNLFQAERSGADVITMPISLINNLKNWNKSLEEFSLETVRMFYNDAKESGYDF
jgi:transaldolase